MCGEMAEVGTTTHDEWYGDLRQGLNLDGWYDHAFVSPQARASEEATRQGIMDGTIESTVVDTGAASNVGKYGCGLTLTGKPSTRIYTVANGENCRLAEVVIHGRFLRGRAVLPVGNGVDSG